MQLKIIATAVLKSSSDVILREDCKNLCTGDSDSLLNANESRIYANMKYDVFCEGVLKIWLSTTKIYTPCTTILNYEFITSSFTV